MQRKSFGNMQCPIARSLERVGEWWSILIPRDAFYGLTRFDEFQKSLDIAPNMLTRWWNPGCSSVAATVNVPRGTNMY
jgi:DNA-binding HxlR family transcriptional regulator